MLASKLVKQLNQNVFITLGGLTFECKVIDAKNSFGHDRLLLTPLAGFGEAWFNYSSTQRRATKVSSSIDKEKENNNV